MDPNHSCSLSEIKKYMETLYDSFEKLLSSGQNPNDRDLLLQLRVMLKSDAVPVFIDNLTYHKLNLPAFRKVQEIDDALDELYIRGCKLPIRTNLYLLRQERMSERNELQF